MLPVHVEHYDVVGQSYSETRRAEPGIVGVLAIVLEVDRGGTFLDIACGSGNYAAALAQRGGCWTGVDISETMLRQARGHKSSVSWALGRAEELPIQDNALSGAIIVNALHFLDASRVFHEAYRALSAGRLIIFAPMPDLVRTWWLGRYFPDMIDSIARSLLSEADIHSRLLDAGFKIEETQIYFVAEGPVDLFIYSGKYAPEIYFKKKIRDNMSQFRNLCRPAELDAGLNLLRRDLESGAFWREHLPRERIPDYAFVIARK
ncbi:class I SAM-dependent methyltransferase [Methylosinus sp. H3A]|uniref:class I SAM-dependent methyltransferase n=1 Tax=Methylosinus sp. H3A TaxID=2785786 RepID=UPI0018C21A0F|nr:class I SAM-dependent methyltransferase [Methylosinus sp. H3A]MBG0808247.1 class I SAM-dependent methyltransferase [Methylosinus sp. H3A]